MQFKNVWLPILRKFSSLLFLIYLKEYFVKTAPVKAKRLSVLGIHIQDQNIKITFFVLTEICVFVTIAFASLFE